MSQHTIGRYTILEEIGRGGMASVYRGFDPRFKRDVAIKVMTRDLLQDETLITRFEREAQTIAALEHPAIVPVYDFGEDDGRPYLVMRLMTGGTLTDQLKLGPLSIENTVAILGRIGSALERAHKKGIIHRDLKPSNIMFDDYGDAFLADFGIARLTESAVTLTGDSVIGTPAYMSPEQIHGDKEIDGRSDIYALGVICFEMLTGRRPYEDTTPAKVMMRHIMDPVPDIRKIKPDLPDVVDHVITKTMAKDPADRFSSPAEVTTTLSSLSAPGLVTRQVKPAEETEEELPVTEIEPITPQEKTEIPAPVRPAPKTEQPVGDDHHVTVPEPQLATEIPTPETEVMAPSFVSEEIPPTEVGVPTPPEHPETEIARPAFAVDKTPTKQTTGNRRRIYFGIFGLIIVIILVGGGIGLYSLLSGKEDEEEEPTPTTVAVRPTEKEAEPVEIVEPVDTRRPEPPAEEDAHEAAEAQLEIFYRAMDEEDYDLALATIDRAISLVPDEPWYFHEKSWLLLVLGELEAANEVIDIAIELEPDASHHYERRGTIRRDMGDLEGSIMDLQQAVELDPSNPYAHFELAVTLREMDELQAALEEFNQAIELAPEDDWIYAERADNFLRMGEPMAALGDFERALELAPDESWYLESIANIYTWDLGNPEAALEYINTAIDRQPEAPWLYITRVGINRELGNIEALLPDHNRAIELAPEESGLLIERGNTYDNYLNNPEAALDDYVLATEIDPENFDAHFAKAMVLFHRFGDIDGARAAFDRAAEIAPEEAWFYNEREVFFKEIGDIDAAMADLDRCLSLDHEYYWCYYDRGWLRVGLGAIDEAISDFERYLELAPEDDCPECRQELLEFIELNG